MAHGVASRPVQVEATGYLDAASVRGDKTVRVVLGGGESHLQWGASRNGDICSRGFFGDVVIAVARGGIQGEVLWANCHE